MEVFDGHRALFRPLLRPAIALGNFDGVHLGHQRLLGTAVAAAARLRGDSVVFTFEPHPSQILCPDLAPQLITSRARKLELIAAAGIGVCVVERFTRELACLPPEAFLDEILTGALGAAEIIVGYDFSYGRNAAGTAASLGAYARAHDIAATIVDPVTVSGEVASSSKVRYFADRGNLDGVRLLLGRDLDVDGVVVRGAGRGKTIGVPTANLAIDAAQLLPRPGVYAVRPRLLDGEAPGPALAGVANLGTNPTFRGADGDAGALSLEVHLFDFTGDLYDRRLRVAFAARLRPEHAFPSVDALVAQIRADAAHAREVLAAAPST
jgi:riboflavin kinase/FMN adenylyltransferase